MMAMAENLTVTVPADDGPVAAEADVTMMGEVTLDKDILQTKYGLTYDEKQRQYYYLDDAGARQPLGPNNTVTPPEAANMDRWATVLSKLGGEGITLQDIEVDEKGAAKMSFTAQFKTKEASTFTKLTGKFGVSLAYPADKEEILEKAYGLHSTDNLKYDINYITPDGHASIAVSEQYSGNALVFDTENGHFSYVGDQGQTSVTLSFAGSTTDLSGGNVNLSHFTDISIDFSSLLNINNGKVSTAGLTSGDGSSNNLGSGRKRGELIGVEIGQDGKIRASYDNGMTKLLGQIAVAKFANAAGLAKAGNNLYSTTMNSGEFDGIGIDITSDGEGSMESGVLEMSNVDLASEFTEMITTQRGFQANSRIITTSDSMLEELVNLKR
ncbi:MAG: flagellar hook-basal body complex protein [Lachnospiraceae bacterium]|nr:flagellar hook-basal body complex protein [Lachnospiraceae bacterium]